MNEMYALTAAATLGSAYADVLGDGDGLVAVLDVGDVEFDELPVVDGSGFGLLLVQLVAMSVRHAKDAAMIVAGCRAARTAHPFRMGVTPAAVGGDTRALRTTVARRLDGVKRVRPTSQWFVQHAALASPP